MEENTVQDSSSKQTERGDEGGGTGAPTLKRLGPEPEKLHSLWGSAVRDLFLEALEEVTFPDSALNRLAVIRESNTGLLLCRRRFQFLNDDKAASQPKAS